MMITTSLSKPRLSSFELLRVFSMLLILVHHFICHGIKSNQGITGVMTFVDSFAIIGVNLFLLISGYFKIRLTWKSFLNLVFVCMFCKVVHLCADTFVLGVSHPLYEWVLKPVFVVSRSGGWFVQVYFMLMFVSPLLNKGVENLSSKEWSLSLLLLCVITFYLGWGLHNYNDSAGYTLMNFVFIYVVGAAIRHYRLIEQSKVWHHVLAIVLGVSGTFFGRVVGGGTLGFMAYNSPFVVLTACAVFCLFGKLQFQCNFVNKVAASMLTVYLLTDGGNISKILYAFAGDIACVCSSSIAILLFVAMAVVIIPIVACLDQIRQIMFKKFFRFL